MIYTCRVSQCRANGLGPEAMYTAILSNQGEVGVVLICSMSSKCWLFWMLGTNEVCSFRHKRQTYRHTHEHDMEWLAMHYAKLTFSTCQSNVIEISVLWMLVVFKWLNQCDLSINKSINQFWPNVYSGWNRIQIKTCTEKHFPFDCIL